MTVEYNVEAPNGRSNTRYADVLHDFMRSDKKSMVFQFENEEKPLVRSCYTSAHNYRRYYKVNISVRMSGNCVYIVKEDRNDQNVSPVEG